MSEKIAAALRKLVDKRRVAELFTGTVAAVNGMNCDVDPSDGGSVLFDVRLKVSSTSDEAGIYCIPKVGSKVVLAMLDSNIHSCIVLQVERIDRYVLELDNGTTLECRQNGLKMELASGAAIELKPAGLVELNGASNGGLIKVNELRTELQLVNAFLNGIRAAIAAAPVSPGDGGAAFKAAIIAAISGFTVPTYANIESQSTKHGGA